MLSHHHWVVDPVQRAYRVASRAHQVTLALTSPRARSPACLEASHLQMLCCDYCDLTCMLRCWRVECEIWKALVKLQKICGLEGDTPDLKMRTILCGIAELSRELVKSR